MAKLGGSSSSLCATIYASRFAANALTLLRRNGREKGKEMASERTPNGALDESFVRAKERTCCNEFNIMRNNQS